LAHPYGSLHTMAQSSRFRWVRLAFDLYWESAFDDPTRADFVPTGYRRLITENTPLHTVPTETKRFAPPGTSNHDRFVWPKVAFVPESQILLCTNGSRHARGC